MDDDDKRRGCGQGYREFKVVIPRFPELEEMRDGEWPVRVYLSGTDSFAGLMTAGVPVVAPVLMDAPEAAALLGISVDAL